MGSPDDDSDEIDQDAPDQPLAPLDEPLRSFSSARMLLACIAEAGGDAAAIARRIGLPEDALSRKTLDLTRRGFLELCEAAVATTRDPCLGVTLARRLDRGAYGLVDFAPRTAATLRQALEVVVRFQRLAEETSTFQLMEERGKAVLRHHGLPENRVYNEYVISMIIAAGRQILDGTWIPERAWFAHARPPDIGPLCAFLGTEEVEFGARYDGILFDAATLDRPLRTSDPPLHALLVQQAEQALAAQPSRMDLIGQVREQVRHSLGEGGEPNIERVAARLSVGSRTLQRRLADRGTSFQDVLEEVRESLARIYLADPELGLKEIGERLCYSDVRAFDRAFKRWTGLTPGEYRRVTSKPRAQV